MSKDYYWIVAELDGQPYLAYGGETREKALQNALETLSSVSFRIVAFPTRDRNAASAYLRGKRLRETKSLKQATRRIKHTIRRSKPRKRRY